VHWVVTHWVVVLLAAAGIWIFMASGSGEERVGRYWLDNRDTFPYKVGDYIPPSFEYHKAFARSPAPAYYREPQFRGDAACHSCEGIGWFMWRNKDGILSESQCGVCDGTGDREVIREKSRRQKEQTEANEAAFRAAYPELVAKHEAIVAANLAAGREREARSCRRCNGTGMRLITIQIPGPEGVGLRNDSCRSCRGKGYF
jgi:hypothetical protein